MSLRVVWLGGCLLAGVPRGRPPSRLCRRVQLHPPCPAFHLVLHAAPPPRVDACTAVQPRRFGLRRCPWGCMSHGDSQCAQWAAPGAPGCAVPPASVQLRHSSSESIYHPRFAVHQCGRAQISGRPDQPTCFGAAQRAAAFRTLQARVPAECTLDCPRLSELLAACGARWRSDLEPPVDPPARLSAHPSPRPEMAPGRIW